MRVRLEKPSLDREREFLDAVRRSERFLRGWVDPPGTAGAYRAYVRRFAEPSRQAYFVVLRSGELVGVVNLSEIVRGRFQCAYLGCYGFVPYTARGYMTEGLTLVLRQAFGTLRLHRLEANIQPHNKSSLALFHRLGFRREGYSPRYLKIGVRWRDHERWALLVDEWRDRKRKDG